MLGQVPGRLRRVRRPGPSDRSHGRRAAASRGQRPALALRPHGDGRRPQDRDRPAELRPGGQALRGERGRLSAPAGQPQGQRGEVHPLRHPALLAHHDGNEHRRRPAPARPVLRAHRRPTAKVHCQARGARRQRGRRHVPRCTRTQASERGGSRRARAAAPLPAACYPATIEEHNTVGPSPSCPSRATRTRSRRD